MSNEQFLASFEELISSLTFKRIFLLSLLIAISLLLFLVFENRSVLFSKALTSASSDEAIFEWKMSNNSEELLTSLASFQPVVLTGVIDVDLKKNRRSVKWFYSRDPEVMTIVKNITSRTLPQPMFDYDVKNTQQMIALLNNEFICVKTSDGLLSQWGDTLSRKFPVICRMAIPPYVGKFVGYVIIGVRGQLSKNELDSLKMEATRIAIEIYIRDVVKHPKNSIFNR